MEQHHFDIILEQLIMIENNTRKEERTITLPEADLSPSKIDKTIVRIQDFFFRKLETKTGWGRNEIKQAFIESLENSKKPEMPIISEYPF